ncbi:MAG: AI-2E family transporter [Ktedonobacteraceae bacterium]|nr:AI-2E family transporter [Ktedonobacteraceae bacterium]
MSVQTRSLRPQQGDGVANKWARRRDIPIAILAWVAMVYVVLLGASHIIRTILLLVIASLLAYALAPGVKFLQRFMPRFLAILIMYLVVLGVVSLLLYFITRTAIDQVASLSRNIQRLLTPGGAGQISPIDQTLQSFGISQDQITSVRTQVTGRLETAAGSALPFVTGLFDTILDIILVAVLSIYLLIDGSRVANWFRQNAPQTARADFVLDTLQRVVGGYIRGQFILAVLIGVLVGVGMSIFRVPYAVLLGVLAFFLAFVPVLGTFLSGAICALIALTHGWLIAVVVLIYFIVVHIIEGDVVGPRIVGKAVGLHPVVSLAALVAGSELFGIWGALFASPVAGVLQALVIAIWTNWRSTHPEQFEITKQKVADKVDEGLSGGSNNEEPGQHVEAVENDIVSAVPEQKK